MKKNFRVGFAILAILLLAAAGLEARSARRPQLTLRAGLNLFQSCGSEGDYAAGENDFPVTPAHQAPMAGVGLAFGGKGALEFGVELRYGLAATVDLRDPSDGEVVGVDTPQGLVAVLSLAKPIELSPSMRLVLSLGAGGEYRLGGDQEFVSSLGNRIVLLAPEKPFAPLAAFGAGLQVRLAGSLGLALDLQGAYVFRDPAQLVITPTLGLILKL